MKLEEIQQEARNCQFVRKTRLTTYKLKFGYEKRLWIWFMNDENPILTSSSMKEQTLNTIFNNWLRI